MRPEDVASLVFHTTGTKKDFSRNAGDIQNITSLSRLNSNTEKRSVDETRRNIIAEAGDFPVIENNFNLRTYAHPIDWGQFFSSDLRIKRTWIVCTI